jgi:hypothetical protein
MASATIARGGQIGRLANAILFKLRADISLQWACAESLFFRILIANGLCRVGLNTHGLTVRTIV